MSNFHANSVDRNHSHADSGDLDPNVRVVEDAFLEAAKTDWRAALAWLAHHPQTKERYKQKAVNWSFSWDTE